MRRGKTVTRIMIKLPGRGVMCGATPNGVLVGVSLRGLTTQSHAPCAHFFKLSANPGGNLEMFDVPSDTPLECLATESEMITGLSPAGDAVVVGSYGVKTVLRIDQTRLQVLYAPWAPTRGHVGADGAQLKWHHSVSVNGPVSAVALGASGEMLAVWIEDCYGLCVYDMLRGGVGGGTLVCMIDAGVPTAHAPLAWAPHGDDTVLAVQSEGSGQPCYYTIDADQDHYGAATPVDFSPPGPAVEWRETDLQGYKWHTVFVDGERVYQGCDQKESKGGKLSPCGRYYAFVGSEHYYSDEEGWFREPQAVIVWVNGRDGRCYKELLELPEGRWKPTWVGTAIVFHDRDAGLAFVESVEDLRVEALPLALRGGGELPVTGWRDQVTHLPVSGTFVVGCNGAVSFRELAKRQHPAELGGGDWKVQVPGWLPLYDVDLPAIARAARRGELNLDDPWLVVYVDADSLGDDELAGDLDEAWAALDALGDGAGAAPAPQVLSVLQGGAQN